MLIDQGDRFVAFVYSLGWNDARQPVRKTLGDKLSQTLAGLCGTRKMDALNVEAREIEGISLFET